MKNFGIYLLASVLFISAELEFDRRRKYAKFGNKFKVAF